MRPLRHGYTNRTLGDGAVVRKTYDGPDAAARLHREHTLLRALRGRVPVPPVLRADDDTLTLTLGFVPGVHGQELLDAGRAERVLESCGQLLRRLHSGPPDLADLPVAGAGEVLVHGDFGPQNLLLDPSTFEVTALLDWEFARLGEAVEDLAWCEWIVRIHHPEHVRSLGRFFAAYGAPVPAWPERRAAMLAKCGRMKEFCRRRDAHGPGVRQWEERARITAAWRE
ncbi:phosphotransferase family protein [Streptomyces cellulosae]|uniref:Phosphotransferase family protein n=1 Tax=Streptomyces cellulosae TaxID=1968 RepID=A0ABW7Y6S8_STRCE